MPARVLRAGGPRFGSRAVSPRIAFHPRLVEEAVWAALRGRPEAVLFHRERDPIYRMEEPEERDQAFERLHERWLRRLDLDAPVRRAEQEHATTLAVASRCLIAPAFEEKTQGAELYVAASGERSIVITIRPDLLAAPDRALAFLRRELLHVDDMLDPGFRYEPRLPGQAAGPAHDRLLQDRYRLLWSCSVDGRLARHHGADPGVRERRRLEFGRAFSCLGCRADEGFARFFDGPRPSHPELVSLAAAPEAMLGLRAAPGLPHGRCPLCGFPTHDFEPRPADLSTETLAAIRSDFPEWTEDSGLCRQCADLYRSRDLSDAAADALPGIDRLAP